jgi:predicted DNA-binding transcriptional regulator AlpA
MSNFISDKEFLLNNKNLLRQSSAAKFLGISLGYFQKLEKTDKTFPQRIQLSKNVVLYEERLLIKWLAQKI